MVTRQEPFQARTVEGEQSLRERPFRSERRFDRGLELARNALHRAEIHRPLIAKCGAEGRLAHPSGLGELVHGAGGETSGPERIEDGPQDPIFVGRARPPTRLGL